MQQTTLNNNRLQQQHPIMCDACATQQPKCTRPPVHAEPAAIVVVTTNPSCSTTQKGITMCNNNNDNNSMTTTTTVPYCTVHNKLTNTYTIRLAAARRQLLTLTTTKINVCAAWLHGREIESRMALTHSLTLHPCVHSLSSLAPLSTPAHIQMPYIYCATQQ